MVKQRSLRTTTCQLKLNFREATVLKKTIVFLVVLLCASLAIAQEAPKAEVFGGYQYTNVDLKDLSGRQNTNGWDADVAFHVTKNFSLVGDISGAYKTETIDTSFVTPVGTTQFATLNPRATVSTVEGKVRLYNYLFGPRFSFSSGKVTPFVEALFGLTHTTISASASGVTESIGSNGFGMAIGGGLDYNASKRIAIRLAKFDYMLNQFKVNNTGLGVDVSENLNNFRYATGIVFKF